MDQVSNNPQGLSKVFADEICGIHQMEKEHTDPNQLVGAHLTSARTTRKHDLCAAPLAHPENNEGIEGVVPQRLMVQSEEKHRIVHLQFGQFTTVHLHMPKMTLVR